VESEGQDAPMKTENLFKVVGIESEEETTLKKSTKNVIEKLYMM